MEKTSSTPQKGNKKMECYPLVNKHRNGISPFSIGNTSSIRVHFPASYVSLPECNMTSFNRVHTLPETNSEFTPENSGPLEKEIPNLETTIFRCELLMSC